MGRNECNSGDVGRCNELVRIEGTEHRELHLTIYEHMGLGENIGRITYAKKSNGRIFREEIYEGVPFDNFVREVFA